MTATRDEPAIEESAFGRFRHGNVDVVRDYGVVIAFVVLFVTLSIKSSVFLTLGRT